MTTLATVSIAVGLVVGTVAPAGAATIRSSGPYSTLSACKYGQNDLVRFGTAVRIVQYCHYRAPSTDRYGRYVPGGYYFVYTQG
jgi:hypothetical protein